MDPLALLSLQLTAGEIRSEDLPMLAANLLVDGYDTPALREAAGVSSYDSDNARSTFRQALTELGLTELPESEAWWQLAKHTAQRIVDGELPARNGCEEMRRIDRIIHCRDLDWFVGIESAWEGDPGHADEYTRQTRGAATELLGLNRPRRWIRLFPRSHGPFFGEVKHVAGSDDWWDIDDHDVPITAELHRDIHAWASIVENDLDDNGRPVFATTADAERFVERGLALTREIQAQLGAEWVVEFYPPPTHPQGKRWEDHGG
jgi:hypothetical protein